MNKYDDEGDNTKAKKARKPKAHKVHKVPRKMTESRLANIALHYLERYSSSEENLRQVLIRRVIKTAHAHPETDIDEAKGWIDALIVRYVEVGLLNDAAYAEAKTRSGLERGEAPRVVAMKLAQKGVSKEISDAALEGLAEDFPVPEFQAALTHIRKNRIGPYRMDDEKRKEMREKDLAKMARAGFSYDTTKRMIDAEDIALLESEIEIKL